MRAYRIVYQKKHKLEIITDVDVDTTRIMYNISFWCNWILWILFLLQWESVRPRVHWNYEFSQFKIIQGNNKKTGIDEYIVKVLVEQKFYVFDRQSSILLIIVYILPIYIFTLFARKLPYIREKSRFLTFGSVRRKLLGSMPWKCFFYYKVKPAVAGCHRSEFIFWSDVYMTQQSGRATNGVIFVINNASQTAWVTSVLSAM